MPKQSSTNSKPYQIKMDEQVHALLKKRAKQLDKMTIGDFIQNLLSSLEYRILAYKQEIETFDSMRNDELDARLIKMLMLKDTKNLTDADVKEKLGKIKSDFVQDDYKPDLTITDDNGI